MITVSREDMSPTCPWANDIERKSESRASEDGVWTGIEGVLDNRKHVRGEDRNQTADTFIPWGPILPEYHAGT